MLASAALSITWTLDWEGVLWGTYSSPQFHFASEEPTAQGS